MCLLSIDSSHTTYFIYNYRRKALFCSYISERTVWNHSRTAWNQFRTIIMIEIQLDVQRFLTLVCSHSPPSSLTERFISNHHIVLNKSNATLHPISNEEFLFLLDLFKKNNEPALAGWTLFIKSALEENSSTSISPPSKESVVEANVLENPHVVRSCHVTAPSVTIQTLPEAVKKDVREDIETSEHMNVSTESVGYEKVASEDGSLTVEIGDSENMMDLCRDPNDLLKEKDFEISSGYSQMEQEQDSEEKDEEPGQIPHFRITQDLVETIIDGLENVPDAKKCNFKSGLKKFYVDGFFDMKTSLRLLLKLGTAEKNRHNYEQLLQIFTVIPKSHALDQCGFAQKDLERLITTLKWALESSRKGDLVKDKDIYSEVQKVSWEELCKAVDDFSGNLLEQLDDSTFSHKVLTRDIQSAVRMRLYTFVLNPPRKDEYRYLLSYGDKLEEPCNYFYSKHARIYLQKFDMVEAYGEAVVELDNITAILLDYLRRRQKENGFRYLFASKKDAPVSKISWEEMCMEDFKRITGHALDSTAVRTLFLNSADTVSFEDPYKRIETIVKMGHCLREHYNLCQVASVGTKRKHDGEECGESSTKKRSGDV